MKIILTITFVIIYSIGYAQENKLIRKKSKIIDEIQFNLNGKTSKSGNVVGNKFGFGFGIKKYIDKNSSPNYYLIIELNKTSGYLDYREGSYWIYSDMEINFTTLSVAGMRQFNFGDNINFFVEFGLFLEYEINVNETYRVTSPDGIYDYKASKTDSNGPNIGAIGGIGIKIPMGNSLVLITMQYKADFSRGHSSSIDSYNISYPRLIIGWGF